MTKYITLKKHDLQELLETVQMYQTEKWETVGEYTCKRTKESSKWESNTNGRTSSSSLQSAHYKGLFRSASYSESSSEGAYSSTEKGAGELNVEYTYEQVIKRECNFSWMNKITNSVPLDYYNNLIGTTQGERALNNKILNIIDTSLELEKSPEPTILEGRIFMMEGFHTRYLDKPFSWVLRIYDMDGNIIIDTMDVGYDLFDCIMFKYDNLLVTEPLYQTKSFGGNQKMQVLKSEHDIWDKYCREEPYYSKLHIEGAVPMRYDWYGKVSSYYVLNYEIQSYYKGVRERIGTKGNFKYKDIRDPLMGLG